MSNRSKTLFCVMVAGLLFIMAVIYDMRYLIVIGAFFDWLPLPTKWMRISDERKKPGMGLVFLHVVLTLTAYLFAIVWFFDQITVFKFLFLETWWLAVMMGAFMTQ